MYHHSPVGLSTVGFVVGNENGLLSVALFEDGLGEDQTSVDVVRGPVFEEIVLGSCNVEDVVVERMELEGVVLE